jgi:hypothetical protein
VLKFDDKGEIESLSPSATASMSELAKLKTPSERRKK